MRASEQPDPPPPVDLRLQLEALLVTWRERCYQDRLRAYNGVAWKAVAVEREKCVTELEALLHPAAPPADVEKLGEVIANALFTSRNGERASRLALLSHDGRDLGGWGERPAARQIARALKGAAAPQRQEPPSHE